MSEKIVLTATKRTVVGKQVKALRRAGKLPGVIYGKHIEPVAISLEAHESGRILAGVGPSTLITIDVEGQQYPVLVRDRQYNYIYRYLTHIDFLAVSMTETLRAEVRVELTGKSSAVKDFSAVVVHLLESLEVECLPKDLPENFTLDISGLKNIGDSLTVADLKVPAGVELLHDPEEVIVQITAPMGEEVETDGISAEPERIERARGEEDF